MYHLCAEDTLPGAIGQQTKSKKEKVRMGSVKQPVAFPVIHRLWQTMHTKREHKC